MNAKQEIEKRIKLQKIYLRNADNNEAMFEHGLELLELCLSLIEKEEEERKCEDCYNQFSSNPAICPNWIAKGNLTYCSNFKHKDNK